MRVCMRVCAKCLHVSIKFFIGKQIHAYANIQLAARLRAVRQQAPGRTRNQKPSHTLSSSLATHVDVAGEDVVVQQRDAAAGGSLLPPDGALVHLPGDAVAVALATTHAAQPLQNGHGALRQSDHTQKCLRVHRPNSKSYDLGSFLSSSFKFLCAQKPTKTLSQM